jgi:hypothetical protein
VQSGASRGRHFMIVSISARTASVKAVKSDGGELDEFDIPVGAA